MHRLSTNGKELEVGHMENGYFMEAFNKTSNIDGRQNAVHTHLVLFSCPVVPGFLQVSPIL